MSDYYVPGAEEKDPKKVIYSLQQAHEKTATNTDDIATNTADIATNTANIATNTADIATNAANIAANTAAIAALVRAPDVILEEQQGATTHAGTFTSGAWQTRVLNTAVRNVGSIASLSSNQITLGAGTYHFRWMAPGYFCNGHKSRLQNITDATTVAIGTAEFSPNAVADMTQSWSTGSFVVTISGSKAFEIQHQCQTTAGTAGFGRATGFSVIEVYTRVEITKLA